ncbi:hypothetical protein CKAH01_08310 [Colletotrichum kahawae]|uniref:Uncharacterized protein n=1 Tax=Colletotrichum kahawae TaxID=34407 RepID=A0AAE0D0J1_COLKA|nr:hypothetical protein CKAH01_08310 [Colletotrichum kahawae]
MHLHLPYAICSTDDFIPHRHRKSRAAFSCLCSRLLHCALTQPYPGLFACSSVGARESTIPDSLLPLPCFKGRDSDGSKSGCAFCPMALGVPSSCSLALLVVSPFAEEHPRFLIGSFGPSGRVHASPVLYSSLHVRIDCLSPALGPGPLLISTSTSRFNGSGQQAWFMGAASTVHIGSPHGISPQIEIMSDSSQSVPLLLAAAASALLFSPVACYRTHLRPFTHFIPSLSPCTPFPVVGLVLPLSITRLFSPSPLCLDMAMTLPH